MSEIVQRANMPIPHCVPGRKHCLSVPDEDGIRECLWCGMVSQEAIADSQAKARKALGAGE